MGLTATYTYATPSGGQATVVAFTDLIFQFEDGVQVTVIEALSSGPLSVIVRNNHATAALDWQLMGHNNRDALDADWTLVDSGAAIAALATDPSEQATAFYQFYKVQVRNASGGATVSSAEAFARHARI